MPKISARGMSFRSILDFDFVAGLIVNILLRFVILQAEKNIPQLSVLQTSIYNGLCYDDVMSMALELLIAWISGGRVRKIFIYAFMVDVAVNVWELMFGSINGTGFYYTGINTLFNPPKTAGD